LTRAKCWQPVFSIRLGWSITCMTSVNRHEHHGT
jgi:hypothetical protein